MQSIKALYKRAGVSRENGQKRGLNMPKLQFEVPENCTMPKVVIAGNYYGDKTFPSLNNLLADYAKAPQIGGSTKRKYKDICSWEIRDQLRGYKAQKPLILHYRFFEPAKGQKRDLPNVMSMVDKCFEDALQDCGVIPNDSPKYMLNITHDFFYTDGEPYFEVYIEEVDV